MTDNLFPYQQDCIDIIKDATRSRKKALLSIALGFGRSVIVIQALKELFVNGEIENALIVTPKKVLVYQYSKVLSEQSIANIRLTSRMTFEKEDVHNSVSLLTIHLLRKISQKIPFDLYDIIFVDDCHLLSLNDLRLIDNFDTAIIGLTTAHSLLMKPRLKAFFRLEKPTYSYGISTAKLKDLADILPGANYSSADVLDRGYYRFIRPRNVQNSKIQEPYTFASERIVKRNPRSILAPGDIILQNIFAFNKMAIVKEKDVPSIASKNFLIIRPKNVISSALFDYLQSEAIRRVFMKQLNEISRGAPIRHINLAALREMPIPLIFPSGQFDDTLTETFLGKLSFEELKEARNWIQHVREAYLSYRNEGD